MIASLLRIPRSGADFILLAAATTKAKPALTISPDMSGPMTTQGSNCSLGKVNEPGVKGLDRNRQPSQVRQNPWLHPLLLTHHSQRWREDACAHQPAGPTQPYVLELRWELARLCPAISGGGWCPRCRNCWELSMWLGWATRFTLCRTLTWSEGGLSGYARFSPVLLQPSEAHLFTPAHAPCPQQPQPPQLPLLLHPQPRCRIPLPGLQFPPPTTRGLSTPQSRLLTSGAAKGERGLGLPPR